MCEKEKGGLEQGQTDYRVTETKMEGQEDRAKKAKRLTDEH